MILCSNLMFVKGLMQLTLSYQFCSKLKSLLNMHIRTNYNVENLLNLNYLH